MQITLHRADTEGIKVSAVEFFKGAKFVSLTMTTKKGNQVKFFIDTVEETQALGNAILGACQGREKSYS